MDLLEELRTSDMLTVSVSGRYAVEPPLVRGGSFSVSERCVPKATGLSWSLSPADVGLGDLPVSLALRGESAGLDERGRPLVRLSVDQEIDVQVSRWRVSVDGARGEITVALSPPIASVGAAAHCEGEPRVAVVALETVGDDNRIEVYVRAGLRGLRRRATVRLTELRLEATAWRPPGAP